MADEMAKARVLYELMKKPDDPRWEDLPWYPHTPGECKWKWIQAAKDGDAA